MTRPLALAVVLIAVLAGAIIGSRLLLEAPITLPPPPPEPRVVVAPPPPPRPSLPVAVVPPPPPPPPTPAPPPPVAVAQPVYEPPPEEQRPAEPPDRIVDDALTLVTSEQVTPEQARNAAEIFAECLHTRPSDPRCARGLRMANRRQLRTLPPGMAPLRPGIPLGPRAQRSAENDVE